MTSAMSAALDNLISPAVLFFALGAFAAWVRSDVALPRPVAQALGIYLMAAIGFKGGVQLREAGIDGEALLGLAAGLVLGMTLPVIAFALLCRFTPVDRTNAGAIAAHYGSVSLVTFGAALTLLEAVGEPTSGYMPAVLALMEAPAIAVGVLLARRSGAPGGALGAQVREAVTSGSVLVLIGATVIGVVLGTEGRNDLDGFFIAPFAGVLALYLLDMGLLAFGRIGALRLAGWRLVAFALYMPLVGGTVGALLGWAIGMDAGDVALLATLAASASYIAAPAAMRIALPEADPGLSMPLVLAVTFPLNLIAGIPLYLAFARLLTGG
ncbi:MAG: sodium-dependent bicarbonate transport family permease [Actinobacteria bacterium]|nr:sodium-dependent bicarbonate transport family permease [Actinomycetota bacterium]